MKLRSRSEWLGLMDRFLAGQVTREFMVDRIELEEGEMLELLRLVKVWDDVNDRDGVPALPTQVTRELAELFADHRNPS